MAAALGVDLVPGMCISVSEGLATRELTLADLSIDGLSPAEDTVTGTAPPSATFWVDAGVGDETPGLEVTSDGNGDWTADFGAIGVDITPYTHVGANIGDADGDQTAFDLQLMELPAFEVHRDAERTLVYFQWWTAPERRWRSSIDDPTTPASPDFTTSIVAEEYPVGGDGFGRWFDYVVKPGDVVTVTDGITTKSHTVTAVAVDLGRPSRGRGARHGFARHRGLTVERCCWGVLHLRRRRWHLDSRSFGRPRHRAGHDGHCRAGR